MEIRVLKYFLAVAREESILRAAESLHLSQPTLSRQLMDLEHELGKKLFIRGARHITLTEEGMLLRNRAEEIVDLVEKTSAEIAADDEIGGDIFIGAGETEAMRLIAKTAKKLQNDHPNIRFHIFSGHAETVTERLDKGLIDFGLLLDIEGGSKYEQLPLPMTDRFGLLVRRDSPLAGKDEIDIGELHSLRLIVPAQSHFNRAQERRVKSIISNQRIAATYNLIYNASLLVEEGLGCALCLDGLIKITEDSPLRFVPISGIGEIRSFVVWKKNRVFSKAAKLFLEKMQEEFAK